MGLLWFLRANDVSFFRNSQYVWFAKIYVSVFFAKTVNAVECHASMKKILPVCTKKNRIDNQDFVISSLNVSKHRQKKNWENS